MTKNLKAMKTHEEKLERVPATLTAENIKKISSNIYAFWKRIWNARDVLKYDLREYSSGAYRSAKIVLAAHDMVESLRKELDQIAEKSGISPKDELRARHILSIIYAVVSSHIVSPLENAYSSMPDRIAIDLLGEANRLLGYLEGLRHDDIIALNIGEPPEDLRAKYVDLIKKIIYIDLNFDEGKSCEEGE